MKHRLFPLFSILSLLLCIAALLLWAGSPGRLLGLDRCGYVLYCVEGRLSVVHFDYFSDWRPQGDERDAYAAVSVGSLHLGAVAAGSGLLPGIWGYVFLRRRHLRCGMARAETTSA